MEDQEKVLIAVKKAKKIGGYPEEYGYASALMDSWEEYFTGLLPIDDLNEIMDDWIETMEGDQ